MEAIVGAPIVTKDPSESFVEYASRLYSNMSEYGLTREDVCALLNKESGNQYSESSYRKYYKAFNDGREFERIKMMADTQDDVFVEMLSKKEELQKLKIQIQDQRRELNRSIRDSARKEHLFDIIASAANNMQDISFGKYISEPSDDEAVLCLSDWHYGMITDNLFNKFDVDVCKHRVEMLSCKVRRYLTMSRPSVLHIFVLGDLWHGSIHTLVRLNAMENTVDQMMNSCELLAKFIEDIQECVPKTIIHFTYGNHGRVIQNKKESVHDDNLERIVPFWLKERFSKVDCVEIVDGYKDGIIFSEIAGWNVVAAHGDLDSIASFGDNMNVVMNKKYNKNVDYAIMGDKHHLESKDSGIETIICPSLCGVDNYANEKRLYSNPAQLLLIFNKNSGAEGRFVIKLELLLDN